MIITLAYGRGSLPVEFPDDRTTVIEPSHVPGLRNERAEVFNALQQPTAMPPLRDCIRPDAQVCILFTDITRATPNDRLIPWLLEYLSDVPKNRITLLNQLGTHRPNTVSELEQMLTPDVVRNYKVINHEPENARELVEVGTLRDGTPALLNRHCVEADLRIVTGFIEPHFFAGFSGGPKGIMPGVAGLSSVMSNHGSRNLSDPNATFGVTAGNPLWEELRDVALRAGPSFLLNVTLNHEREITGVFAGDLLKAHKAGCEFVRASAMRKCSQAFDLVVTTNSGYPLDLNLYQGVKGMSAAARIVKPGGKVILACECSDGVPANSHFDNLLRRVRTTEELLTLISAPGFSEPEQWQAHIQALIQKKAQVALHSSLPDEIVRTAHLEPCADIGEAVAEFVRQRPGARIAVLPQGPLTIPYLEG
jgi:nickel-dependent lactate racemase